MSASSPLDRPIKVALTRETGANEKLRRLLHNVQCYQIPCIDFSVDFDVEILSEMVRVNDVVVITSPHSASTFLSVWREMGCPQTQVASVGRGTSKPLEDAGLKPFFEPSDATALTLATELPEAFGRRILYPTSSIADGKLQRILTSRGFQVPIDVFDCVCYQPVCFIDDDMIVIQVTRTNTYATKAATLSAESIALGRQMDIVTFASPSAVHNWAAQVGVDAAAAVTIGPTSAEAARLAGFHRVFCPDSGSKGVGAWADLILKVAANMRV